jgi:hypothetical protein
MALSKIQIIAQALFQNGLGTINTIDPNNPQQVDAEKAFDILYPKILSEYDWRFATKIIQLSRLVETPIIDEWKYAYQLPADYLVGVRTYPLSPFQIYEDKIYSNNEELKLEYRFPVNITKAPQYFVFAMIYALSEYLALPFAEKVEYLQAFQSLNNPTMRKAIFLESQAHPGSPIASHPFINVRYGSGDIRGVR